jgi:hypothetical protein
MTAANHEGLSADTKGTKKINGLRDLRGYRVAIFVVVGCVGFWTARPQQVFTHGAVTTTVLFDREVVRVLNDHCVMCHMAGGIAFPLESYEETWRRGQTIRTSVLRHHMPPWPAVPGYGTFLNANRLTVREAQFVISWVEGLGPRNAGKVFLNVADPNAVRQPEVGASYLHAGHWMIGTPDVKRELAATTVRAQGDVTIKTVVDLGLDRERRVDALEYMPGDRRVVRAAVFTIEQTGQWLGSWTPWYGFVKAPAGAAFRLAPGARVVAEIHYRGANETVVDRGTIGVTFAGDRPTRDISDLVIMGDSTSRPGTLRARSRLVADTYFWALQPRTAPGLTSIQISARRPDGRIEILLFARDISAEWPTPYLLDRPVLLPRGTEVTVSAHYANNPPVDRTLLILSRYRG